MAVVCQDTAFAVVKGMIIGTADEINSQPFQIFQQLRIRRHEGSLGDTRSAFIPVMSRPFEISESGIGAAQDLRESEKPFFLKNSEPAGKHGVARQRYREITFFCLVGHFFLPS